MKRHMAVPVTPINEFRKSGKPIIKGIPWEFIEKLIVNLLRTRLAEQGVIL